MESAQLSRLALLGQKIDSYGKENQEDILHVLVQAINLITGQNRCRIYLEDLTAGCLTCAAASGRFAETIRQHSFPITSSDYLVSQVFHSQQEAYVLDVVELETAFLREQAEQFDIRATVHLPLVHKNRSIGVICIDSNQRRQLPDEQGLQLLRDFLGLAAPTIDQARKYHQQVLLAREIDAGKKRRAAFFMVRSAVSLIDKLALASVLIPSPAGGGGLQILASFSPEKELKRAYEDDTFIDLGTGRSLLSHYINDAGIIIDELLLKPIYFPDLPAESLQKQYLTEQLGLQSLYVVPRYESHTRRVICLVNYYTREAYQFDDFEKGLLEAHAEMAQRVIQEIGSEHMEIQVLAEINDLLQEKFDALQPFLNRVLSKAVELIGADTGSIALVQESDGQNWLVVEEHDGTLIGAKSKEWLKKNIPPIPVGAEELPPEQRSLTGLAAVTGEPQMIRDTLEERLGRGFYREITEDIKSELAVPVLHDEEVLAVICLDSLSPFYFTDEHIRILQIIVRLISRHLFDLQRIELLTGEVQQLRSDVGYRDPKIHSYRLGNIIGNSDKARQIIDLIQTISPPVFNRIVYWSRSDVQEATLGLPSILITGETGSGKEFIFNNIFSRLNEMYQANIDPQGELPVKKTNIAAYSGDLTYSELFGHKRGAFTGAHTDRKGILEEAHGGVVFLDEIGDADPKTQVQLLRFLDNGGFVRLGENQTRYARVLLVAATNKDLGKLIREGSFREDLYHRLSELTIEIPPLNQRREDIPDLATHFLGRLYSIYHRPGDPDEPPSITRKAQELLTTHNFSGNIRELRSILVRALFFHQGRTIDEKDIRRAIGQPRPAAEAGTNARLTQELAQEILAAIEQGNGSFWDRVYLPFSDNRIARDVVLEVIAQARTRGAASMPKLARLLRACDPGSSDPEERKRFYRFKNFLYKTIRIS
jgi:transcriptional regulator with GAF, ATPase, and Fis domain